MKKTNESEGKQIIAVNTEKRIIQIVLKFPRLIMNNFGMGSKLDIAADHMQIEADKKDITKGKKRSAKTLEGEVTSHVEYDGKRRVAFLARHIMASIVDAFNISVTEQDNKRKNQKTLRRALRVEGVEEPHFCPISFKASGYRTRIDNVLIGGMNKVASIAIRPMFQDCEIRCNLIFQPDLISEESVISLVTRAGQCIGAGAWTPDKDGDFGLFEVEGVKYLKKDPCDQPKFDNKLIERGFKAFIEESSLDKPRIKAAIERFSLVA